MSRFAEVMRDLRQRRGLSLRALGNVTFIDPAHLSRLERGLREPTQEAAAAVDQALDADGALYTLAPQPDPVEAGVRESERLAELFAAPDPAGHAEAAEHLAVAYLSTSAGVMLDRTTTARREAVTAMRRARRSSSDTVRAIGQLSGILAYATLDLGHPEAARAHCKAAWRAAEAIGDDELRAWVRGTESLIARFQGQYVRALRLAEDGLRYAPEHGTGRARLLSGVGQSAANLVDTDEAHAALGAALDARELVQHDEPGLFGFSEAKQRYYLASSAMWLPDDVDARTAIEEAQIAIRLWQAGDPLCRSLDDEALAHVYAATSALQLGELEQATEFLEPILGLPEDRRISWIRARLARIAGILDGPRYQGSPDAAALRQRIAEYR